MIARDVGPIVESFFGGGEFGGDCWQSRNRRHVFGGRLRWRLSAGEMRVKDRCDHAQEK